MLKCAAMWGIRHSSLSSLTYSRFIYIFILICYSCAFVCVCVCLAVCVLDNLFKPRERSISGREMQLRSRRWVHLMSLSSPPPPPHIVSVSPSLIHHATLSHPSRMQLCKAQTQIVIHAARVPSGSRGWLPYKMSCQEIRSSLCIAYLLLFLRFIWEDTPDQMTAAHCIFFSGKATLSDREDLLTNWLELLEWKRGPRETYLSADPGSCWLPSHQIIPFGLSDASALARFS